MCQNRRYNDVNKFVSLRYRSGTRIFRSLGEVPTLALGRFGGLCLVVCPKLRFVTVCMREHGVNAAGALNRKPTYFMSITKKLK